MPNTTTRLRSLPPISKVDHADSHLGLFLSDLDSLTSEVERFAYETDDAAFLAIHGIASDEGKRVVDPATVARLLVFADELETDAKAVLDYGQKLRAALLSVYRENILEPSGRREMRGDDA